MGDQTNDVPQQPTQPLPTGAPFPGATPPPPPAQPPAEPVAPPTPAQPAPEGAEKPAKPRRKGCWIAAGIAAVVLVVAFACIAVLVGSALSENAKKRAAFESAETHYAAAVTALDSVEGAQDRIADSGDTKTMARQFAAEVDPAVKKAKAELEQAAQALSGVEDSEAKKAYLGSVDAALAALDQITVMEKELASIGELQAALDPLGETVSKAADELDAATTAASGGKWATGIAKAKSASKRYADAYRKLTTLDKKYSKLGLGVLAKDIKFREQAANELVIVCETGRARRIARYKASLKRFNALAAKTGKQDIPDSLEDPNVLLEQFWDAYGKVNEQLIAAQTEHDKAMKEIEAGNY